MFAFHILHRESRLLRLSLNAPGQPDQRESVPTTPHTEGTGTEAVDELKEHFTRVVNLAQTVGQESKDPQSGNVPILTADFADAVKKEKISFEKKSEVPLNKMERALVAAFDVLFAEAEKETEKDVGKSPAPKRKLSDVLRTLFSAALASLKKLRDPAPQQPKDKKLTPNDPLAENKDPEAKERSKNLEALITQLHPLATQVAELVRHQLWEAPNCTKALATMSGILTQKAASGEAGKALCRDAVNWLKKEYTLSFEGGVAHFVALQSGLGLVLEQDTPPEEKWKTKEEIATALASPLKKLGKAMGTLGSKPNEAAATAAAAPFLGEINTILAESPTAAKLWADATIDSINEQWKAMWSPFKVLFKDSRNEVEIESISEQEKDQRLTDALKAAEEQVMQIFRRESREMQQREKSRKESGWFFGFKKALTTHDPYEQDIVLARQKKNNSERLVQTIRKALDSGERDQKARALLAAQTQIKMYNRIDTHSNEKWEIEKDAIDVSQRVAELALDAAGAVVTLGGSVVIRRAGMAAAKAASKRTVTQVIGDAGRETGKQLGQNYVQGKIVDWGESFLA